MKKLFICAAGETLGDDGSGYIAGAWDIDTLNTGALAVFDEEGNLVDPTGAAPAFTGDRIYLGMGTAEGHPDVSVLIPRTAKYDVRQYVAPVAAVKYLGSDALAAAGNGSLHYPATIAVGDVVGVDIIDLQKPPYELNRVKRYTFNATSSSVLTGDVAGNVIYDLVALINADANRIVNAVQCENGSNLNDGIQFTAVTAGHDFGIGIVPGVLGNADVVEYLKINGEYSAASTTAVANNAGSGTAAQLTELEAYVSTWLGNANSPINNDYLWKRATKVVAGTTYDVVTIRFTQSNDGGLIQESQNPEMTIYVAFAVADRATIEAAFLSILSWFVNSWDEVVPFAETEWPLLS